MLKERGAKEVLPALEAWVKRLDPKDAELRAPPARSPLDVSVARRGRAGLARHAAQRAGTTGPGRRPCACCRTGTRASRTPSTCLRVRATDDAPRVRMEAVRALAATGSPAAVAPAFAALDKPVDRTMDYALWLTARDLEPVWMPKFKAGDDLFRGNLKGLTFALEAVGTASAAQPLLALREVREDARRTAKSAVWELIARTGGPAEVAEARPRRRRTAIARGIPRTRSWRRRGGRPTRRETVRPAGRTARPSLRLVPATPARRSASRLVGLWKVERFREPLANVAPIANECRPTIAGPPSKGLRPSAATKSRLLFNELAAGTNPPANRGGLTVIAAFDLDTAAAPARPSSCWPPPAGRPLDDLFAAFLARKGGAAALAKALDGKKLHPDVAKLGLQAVRASVQDAKPLTEALTKAGGLTAARTDYTPAEIKAYVEEVLTKGDAARGEQVYRRKEATCLACHAIAGAGGQVGPDMTSIGASAQVDYLVESILIPNKAVKEGYHALKVATLDNKVLVGVKTREADGKLYLRNAEDKEIAIAEKDIDEQVPVAVAHAGRAGRPTHPAGVRRPGAVHVRAGQGRRAVRPEQGPPGPPLAGVRADEREHEPDPPGPGGGGGREPGRVRLVERRTPRSPASSRSTRCRSWSSGRTRSRSAWSGPSST